MAYVAQEQDIKSLRDSVVNTHTKEEEKITLLRLNANQTVCSFILFPPQSTAPNDEEQNQSKHTHALLMNRLLFSPNGFSSNLWPP